jgi:hypothetical protein
MVLLLREDVGKRKWILQQELATEIRDGCAVEKTRLVLEVTAHAI